MTHEFILRTRCDWCATIVDRPHSPFARDDFDNRTPEGWERVEPSSRAIEPRHMCPTCAAVRLGTFGPRATVASDA